MLHSGTQSEADAAAVVRVVPVALVQATKAFGGTIALKDASFELRSGEVLALLGENGAGKSTCVKLLAGVHSPTSGHVEVDGKPALFHSPHDAQAAGIAVMHQHPGLFPDLSVAENIYLGHMPRDRFGGIDNAAMLAGARKVLATVGLSVPAATRLGTLRTSEQQLVEIARALSLDARVLIMDEPTAALSQREVERLFAVVAHLRLHAVAMMFVGHRMDEIFRIADRIAVLRDGRLIGVKPKAELGRAAAISMMVGREVTDLYPERRHASGALVLEARGLSRAGGFSGIDLKLHAGEVLGLGGLVGSGRTEIARVLFGIDRPDAGEILIDGKPVQFASARDAMDARIAYVSEDRMGQSLVMDFSILDNAVLPVLDKAAPRGLYGTDRAIDLVVDWLKRMKLRFSGYGQPVKELSGGNQQKVVLAKWLRTEPRVLILDEPTQGIDVGTKAEVHAMIADLAAQGMAILLISSEMPELIGMCDRIVVLREGHQTAEFVHGQATQEKVLEAATKTGERAGQAAQLERAEEEKAKGPFDFLKRREFGLLAAMLAVAIPVTIINPRMVSAANLTAVSMDAALLVVAALAQMLVLITRNIDLSIAAVIGLSAYMAASMVQAYPGLDIGIGLVTACAVGGFAGLLNGLVVTRGKIPAIVVTLASMSIFRGFNSIWAAGDQVSADEVTQAWLDMTGLKIAGVPLIVVIAIVILCAGYVLLYRTAIGRELFATGSNPDGARLIGIPVDRRILLAFGMAGLLGGLCGALWASRYATIDARVALGFELTVIASAVVGGVAIRGGSGTLLGIILGALTLLVIKNGLTLVRVDPLWLQGVYGLVILVAIGIDTFIVRRAEQARQARAR
ncbi:ATP-binding cassette domain-containing protein [Mesorhizobium sp. WSM4303]|uniref:ATP-binding cassette domain-containing protein n=1 Tax=unclassified Mesorhizobium TaxID=325217 RepID=UPI00115F5785|nr:MULTISPECIES: ATP-binding cassette domain-containing protein [unclassified Mesorhizobium]TRC84568.1 ATP-binding cassette domain-containing protein [Mesorhizobium sp. WSM4306]TRD03609.1 ATP-binding cassette domain-containing protein [Mesorhizobium sp. WSM4303]